MPDFLDQRSHTFRTVILTVVALLAFASNSVLCRLALGGKQIDPTSFTTLRLVSGAVVWD